MKKEALVDKSDLIKSSISFLFGLLSTTIGFFLAVYFNNKIEINKELETFATIKKSIIAEVNQNKETLDSSFYKYINGVIFNEFNTISSNQQLTSSIFLKYATPQLLIALQNYVDKCELGNKQKNQLKDFKMAGRNDNWTFALQNSLGKTLADITESMQKISKQLSDH